MLVLQWRSNFDMRKKDRYRSSYDPGHPDGFVYTGIWGESYSFEHKMVDTKGWPADKTIVLTDEHWNDLAGQNQEPHDIMTVVNNWIREEKLKLMEYHHDTKSHLRYYRFKKTRDAMMFKLTWG